MGLSSSEELGRIIAMSVNSSEAIKQDAIPAEILNSLLIAPNESLRVTTIVNFYNRVISNVLTVGHPVYGEVGVYPVFSPMILGHPVWGVLGSGYLSSTVTYTRTLIGTYTS